MVKENSGVPKLTNCEQKPPYFPPPFLADILQCWKSGLQESAETERARGGVHRPGRLWWKGSNEA